MRWRYREEQTELLKNVARGLGIGLEVLTEQLAEILDLPILTSIPLFDPASLPRGLSMRELHRLTVIPLFDNGTIYAMCGIDQDALIRRLPEYAHVPFFLSSPELISLVLERSASSENLEIGIEAEQLVLELFTRLLEFADEFSVSEIVLNTEGQCVTYELRAGGLAVGQGSISDTIRQQLHSFCAESSGRRVPVTLLGVTRIVVIRRLQTCGTFELSLVPGRNTLFLPDAEQHEVSPEKLAATNGSGHSPARSREVLIIDDSPDFLRVLEKFIARAGFRVLTATSGAQAISLLKNADCIPAAIITDLHMPLVDGIKLTEKLRCEDRFLKLPVMFMTSDDCVENELRALAAGAVAVVAKSRDPRILLAHLNRICPQHGEGTS